MRWQAKSALINLVERLPMADTAYHLLQRYGTRSIPRSARSVREVVDLERRHLEVFREISGRDLPGRAYEFGAGWDLCGALVRAALGVTDQVLVDLNRLASVWQINHVIALLAQDGAGRADLGKLNPVRDINTGMTAEIGIRYIAPCDARSLPCEDGAFDLIASTNTMEHIPPADLLAIMREYHRVLCSGGVVSAQVDYSDHFSHSDASITPYNYMGFDAAAWSRHNPARHYQNRLRHEDYRGIFEEAGFRILVAEPVVPPGALTQLQSVKLAESFARYPVEQLLPTSGWFVLQKV